MGIETITSTADYDLRDVAVGIDIDRCVLNTEVAFDTVASAAAQMSGSPYNGHLVSTVETVQYS